MYLPEALLATVPAKNDHPISDLGSGMVAPGLGRGALESGPRPAPKVCRRVQGFKDAGARRVAVGTLSWNFSRGGLYECLDSPCPSKRWRYWP